MNSTLYYTLFLYVIFSLLSCGPKEKENLTIDSGTKIEITNIDNNKFDDTLILSEMFNSIEYVPLEGIKKALFRSAIDIKLSKNFIAINSDNSLYIFSKSGKFISKINSIGKGPFEYLDIHNFQFKNDTTVAILEYNLEKVIEYSVFGDHLQEIQVPQYPGQINYSENGTIYIAFSYPDYFSNSFYFARNLNTEEKYLKLNPRQNIDFESVRAMSTTSLIDFYIDSNENMEYWCFGINKILTASAPDQTNILWDVSIDNKISGPISVDNEWLYFFILHKGGIVNFLYTKSTDILKSFRYIDQSRLQMTIAFQNDLDEGPPFFPHFRTGISSYANTLDYSTIESLKENKVFDPSKIKNPKTKAIFDNIQPNGNPILILAEKKSAL